MNIVKMQTDITVISTKMAEKTDYMLTLAKHHKCWILNETQIHYTVVIDDQIVSY